MNKSLSGIFLLFCLIAPFTMSFMWLNYEKKMLKKEIKKQLIHGIPKDQLVHLKFTVTESKEVLRWEHSKEFEFNGQMYDVVETVINGDDITYICWPDNQETALNIRLNDLVDKAFGNSDKKHENENRLLQFVKSLYIDHDEQQVYVLSYTIHSFTEHRSVPVDRFHSPPVPPPEVNNLS